MIRTKAHLHLYAGPGKRTTAFVSGYRPLFNLVEWTKTSGQILLFDRQELYPGEQAQVIIKFKVSAALGENFGVGATFTFDEGNDALGDGVITEVLEG